MILVLGKGYNFPVIRRLRVKNYKSLANVDLELPGLAVFIGPNNSGKSNLFDALRVLKRMARGEEDITDSGYGEGFFDPFRRENTVLRRECLWTNAKEGFATIGAEVEHNGKSLFYEIKLEPRFDNPDMYPVEELMEIREGGNLFKMTRNEFKVSVGDEWYFRVEHLSSGMLSLLRFGVLEANLPPKILESIGFYAWNLQNTAILFLDPDAIRRPEVISSKPRLEVDGSGLVAILDHLLSTDRKAFDAMVGSLSGSLNEIEDVGFEVLGSETGGSGAKFITVKEKGARKPIPTTLLSDGLLRLLVFYALAYSPVSPRIIAIEEPEDGINPGILDAILELFRDMAASGKHQIFITTHSKLLMDLAKKEEVIVVQKVNGATNFTPLSEHPNIDEFLEDLTVGSLHYSGEV